MNDPHNAGVDWIVTCGGSPVTGSMTGGACGTFSASHTASGAVTTFTAPGLVPIGYTVTVSASLTSDPSQTRSVTLTILPPTIAVQITGLPASANVGASVSLDAIVTNDSAGAGVTWSWTCGSADCGSVVSRYPDHYTYYATYTAPASVPVGGTVTITATSVADSTKSASTTITITAPPPPPPAVSLTIAPSGPYYAETSGAARTVSLAAWVTNDSGNKGVDWAVACQSASCGLFQATHTASGVAAKLQAPATVPTGGTLTVTATSTADPTKSETAVIQIETTTAPITVTISSAPPSTMSVGAQSTLSATVVNDTNNLGINWTATCGSAGACGSFSPSPAHTASGGTITYTAPANIPAGSTVFITASSPATTPANAAAAQTAIVAQPPAVNFVQEPPATLTATAQATVSAVVANDVASGGGVTWTLQCGNTATGGCGSIVPYQTANGLPATYTAPPVKTAGTTVTIIATSTANSTKSASSTPIAIVPSTQLAIGFVPFAPSQMQADSTVSLNAAVSNDTGSQGVDWQVCASGCGFFTTQAAVPAIPATTTTPYVPAVPAVTATTVTGWPNGLPLPYTAPSQQPESGPVTVAIAAHADVSVSSNAQIAITGNIGGPILHGQVLAGPLPVAGASVSLYAASTSGYATQSLPLYAENATPAVQTDVSGNFTIPAGYSCPSPSTQVYLIATGGKPGTSTKANNALAMMTALGACGGLSATPVVVNEVTTVGSVWPLASFAPNEPLVGNTNYLYIGTSSGNTVGLANAFATVNNLVDITTGQALYSVPAGNADVPYAEINTLADILNSCTSTGGGVEGDGSPCGNLLTLLDPLGSQPLYNPTSPTDTLQAMFNLAQLHPDGGSYQIQYNYTSLSALAGPASPFQPVPPSTKAYYGNFSLSLNYTGGGGINSASTVASFALDASGNLWITDTKAGKVAEWNNTGAAVSPSSGFTAGGGPIVVDATGNIWVAGNGQLIELNSAGTPVPGSPYPGVPDGGTDMAFDNFGNLWVTGAQGVAKFNGFGEALSPLNGYTIGASSINGTMFGSFSDFTDVAVDGSNHVRVWGASTVNTTPTWAIADLFDSSGQMEFVNVGSNGQSQPSPQIAFDHSGTLWYTGWQTNQNPSVNGSGSGSIAWLGSYEGAGTFPTSGSITNISTTDVQGLPQIENPGGVAVDGAGTVWFANGGGFYNNGFGGVSTMQPNIVGVLSSSLTITCNASTPLSTPLRAAVDRSGNVWVLFANNTVTEFVGVAAPAITPLASAAASNKLGARP